MEELATYKVRTWFKLYQYITNVNPGVIVDLLFLAKYFDVEDLAGNANDLGHVDSILSPASIRKFISPGSQPYRTLVEKMIFNICK